MVQSGIWVLCLSCIIMEQLSSCANDPTMKAIVAWECNNLYTCFMNLCTDISTPPGNCTQGELRLMGGANLLEGRVEICINNAWGTICDNRFRMEEAMVICRQLGHSEGMLYSSKMSDCWWSIHILCPLASLSCLSVQQWHFVCVVYTVQCLINPS